MCGEPGKSCAWVRAKKLRYYSRKILQPFLSILLFIWRFYLKYFLRYGRFCTIAYGFLKLKNRRWKFVHSIYALLTMRTTFQCVANFLRFPTVCGMRGSSPGSFLQTNEKAKAFSRCFGIAIEVFFHLPMLDGVSKHQIKHISSSCLVLPLTQ